MLAASCCLPARLLTPSTEGTELLVLPFDLPDSFCAAHTLSATCTLPMLLTYDVYPSPSIH